MNPSVDLFTVTDHLVDDGKSRCQPVTREPGGGGINVARNLHRMGIDTLAIFPAGGANGQLLKQLLTRDQLPFQSLEIINETRQSLAVTEKLSGKMFHFVFSGPEFQETEWRHCLAAVQDLRPSPEYLVLTGSLPPGIPDDFYGRLATTAMAQGVKVILDSSRKALAAPMKAGVYLAKLNRGEFADLGYSGSDDYQHMLAAMGEIVESGRAEALIVTLDAEGALLASRNGDRLHVRPPPTKVRSHVGAGDSFVSVLTYQLLRGKPLTEAFRYGVAAAAAKVQIPGNQLTELDRVEQIYQQIVNFRK